MCNARLNAFSRNKNSKKEIQVDRTVAKNSFSLNFYKSFCHDITLSNIKPVEKIHQSLKKCENI